MDKNFTADEWQPTKPPKSSDKDITSELPGLISSLNGQTEDIYRHPYDPECWLRRAETLRLLRYPELAVGDAYKVELLCISVKERMEDHKYRLGYRMGFWMIDDASDEEKYELERKLTKLETDAFKVKIKILRRSTSELFPDHLDGRYMRRQYPWTDGKHKRRGEDVVGRLNADFTKQGQHCVLRRHAFGVDGEKNSSEVFGVFAAHFIPERTRIVVEETEDGIKDLHCHILTKSITAGAVSPLDDTLIAGLTATFHQDKIFEFSVRRDIEVPNQCLRQNGIDIFANQNYDTWVLFTVLAREATNCWSDPLRSCISPLFSMFNHSCEPNVHWCTNKTTMTMTTLHDTDAGEQLFVKYDNYLDGKPLQERRERMRDWLDAPCQCTMCVREERSGSGNHQNVLNWLAGVPGVTLPEDRA